MILYCTPCARISPFPTCRHCGQPATPFYPLDEARRMVASEAGKLGGSKSSPAKTAAVTANSRLPRPNARHPRIPKPETLPKPEYVTDPAYPGWKFGGGYDDPNVPHTTYSDIIAPRRTKDGLEITGD